MTYILFGILLAISIVSLAMSFTLWKKLSQAEKEKTVLAEKIEYTESKIGESIFHMSQSITQQMGNLQKTFDVRLGDNTHKLDARLDHASKSFSQVSSIMERVLESNKHIHALGKDISTLQEILQAPKLRGNLGEYFLEDMLAQIFPKNHYSLQHRFKNGEKVDAVIRLSGGMVSVDSKFPLENFRKMLTVEASEEKKRAQKLFYQDVKKHIDAISQKYIVPDEKTLDFALMYIPAENVYYETIVKDEGESNLLQYAFEKRVIPVSPNTFYVYINTIMIGLKGMQVEEHAQVIMDNLKRLMKDKERFRQEFDILGRHITDSKNKFDISQKHFEKIESQLETTTQENKKRIES